MVDDSTQPAFCILKHPKNKEFLHKIYCGNKILCKYQYIEYL
jgi:hypothetical protein